MADTVAAAEIDKAEDPSPRGVPGSPPPNGGLKAWAQVLGAHFLFFNSWWGIVNSFGVFQTYYQASLLASSRASDISWIGTFQAFLLVALSLAVGPVFDRGYFRTLIAVGTFLAVFGMMMTSLATKYWQVFLAQGLCVGLGAGCLFLPSVALVATYFSTKRALAIGMVAAGGSIGSVIYPIVFYQLQPRIGFPWTMRVLGFIVLVTLGISIVTMRTRSSSSTSSRPVQGNTAASTPKPRAVFDSTAFKNVPFLLVSFGFFLSFVGLYVPIFYIIIWAQRHAHVDTDLSFYLLAILNAASVPGRILPGLLADRFGSLQLITTCTIAASVIAFAGIAIDSLGGLAAFAVLYGFMSGAVVSLPSAVVAALVPDMGLVGTWMGMSFCFAALGILIGTPVAGTIIDVPHDQFVGGFIFSGCLVMMAGVLFLCATCLKLIERKKGDTG